MTDYDITDEHRRQLDRIEAFVCALTDKERQVVSLAVQGDQNKEISTKLCISVKSVEGHLHNITNKFRDSYVGSARTATFRGTIIPTLMCYFFITDLGGVISVQ